MATHLCSCLKNPIQRSWQAAVHGVAESDMAELVMGMVV